MPQEDRSEDLLAGPHMVAEPVPVNMPQGLDRPRTTPWETLNTALGQFVSEHSDLVQALLESLAKVRQLTTDGYAATHAPKPDDPFGYLNDRVSVQRVQVAGGIVTGDPPPVSNRYRPKK